MGIGYTNTLVHIPADMHTYYNVSRSELAHLSDIACALPFPALPASYQTFMISIEVKISRTKEEA
jgi:hypothetical protein